VEEMRDLVVEGLKAVEGVKVKGQPLKEGEQEEARWKSDARATATTRAAEEIVNEAVRLLLSFPLSLRFEAKRR
jgi:hypothetical protein